MDAVKEGLALGTIFILQIMIISLLFRLLHTAIARAGVNPAAFFGELGRGLRRLFRTVFSPKA